MSANTSDYVSVRTGSHGNWRRAAGFFRPHQGLAILIVGLTLVASALNALEPLVLKYVIDDLTGGGTIRTLVIGVTLLAGLGLVRELLKTRTNSLTWSTRLAVHQQLLDALVTRLHRLPLSFYRSEGVGAIMTRLDRSTQGVVEAATQMAFNVLPAVVYLVIMVVVMFSLEWRLALIVLLFAPLQPLITAWAAPEQIARERNLLDRWVRIYSRFNEVLAGITTVRSFAREQYEKERFINSVAEANQQVISGVAYDARLQARQNLIVTFARVAAILVGGSLAMQGRVSVGTLIAFLGYVSGVFTPVQGLSSIYKTIRTASVSLDSIFSILDVQETLGDDRQAIELKKVAGEIEFQNVSFSYDPAQWPLLANINIQIKPGEMVALVGPSGSGKSTIVSLLQRFYDPTDGRILIDGIDIKTVKQDSLRRQIATVSQEPLLFNDTVYANICYSRQDCTPEAAESAAKAAHAHDFISRLPKDYSELVGERGSRLSAGERQRIAIARALLKHAPILVLDEATSALDAESEALIQEALDNLLRDRTSLVIAHRLSTVVKADRVYVLRSGEIVEAGSHDELVALGGYYASLVHHQSKGLLPS
ncbi:MAG TPA: ABC transporter ATP-binding protein [Pyrinomonadaceae bacterium]